MNFADHTSHGCLAEWNVLSMGVYVSQGQDTRMTLKCFLLWDRRRLSHPYHCWVNLRSASWLLTLTPVLSEVRLPGTGWTRLTCTPVRLAVFLCVSVCSISTCIVLYVSILSHICTDLSSDVWNLTQNAIFAIPLDMKGIVQRFG